MKKRALSILIPTYNDDCRKLVGELSRQAESIGQFSYEMLIADDGSTNRQMVEQCQEAVSSLPHVRFIIRQTNSGRAAIRNFLVSEAQYPWLLFLDGDMTIPNDRFLQNYLDCDALIAYGGYNVGQGSLSNLRYRYEKAC